jgi:osmotically-inducible protein OsmY
LGQIDVMIEKSQLESVLKNTISLSGCTIIVKVSKSKVTLSGRVQTPDQKDEAERKAWDVLGVWAVGNDLVIDHGGTKPSNQ